MEQERRGAVRQVEAPPSLRLALVGWPGCGGQAVRIGSRGIAASVAVGLGCASLVTPGEQAQRDWGRRVQYASTALSLADYAEAERAMREARTLADLAAREQPESGTRLVIATELTLGGIARDDDRPAEAETHFRAALGLIEGESVRDDGLHFVALAGLARVLLDLGRLEEARTMHDRAVAVLRPTAPPHDKRLADSYTAMADSFREQGLYEQAVGYYEGSLGVRDFSAGSDRYDVAITLEHYADALDAIGRGEDAMRSRERAARILEGSDYAHDLTRMSRTASQWNVTLALAWPRERFPLRVQVEDADGHFGDAEALQAAVRRAALGWHDVLMPGLPSFTFIDSAPEADVIVRWVDDPGHKGWLGLSRRESLGAPPQRVRIQVATRRLGAEPPLAELEAVLMHEFGHALGLWTHSTYPKDLMYPNYDSDVRMPSERDRATLRRLYF
jgi:predicted Zn-dependent protease